MSKVSKATKKYVKRVIDANAEDKKYTTNQLNVSGVGGIVDNTLGSFQNVTGMAQGVTQQTRVGNRIKPKKLIVRFRGLIGTTAAGADTEVRCIVFRDDDLEAVQPLSSGLLENASQATRNYVVSPYDSGNVPRRFKILFDRKMKLNQNGNTTGALTYFSKKSHLRMIQFGTNAAVIGKGTIRTLVLSEIAAASANLPEVGVSSELLFEDA